MDPKAEDIALAPLNQDPRILRLLTAFGDQPLYFVGGCLRDRLLGKADSDIDLASPLLPEELRLRLEAFGCRVIPTGLQHQTVSVLCPPEKETIEITTFRGSGISSERNRSFSATIEEDLRHRDFTFNAMAMRCGTTELLDPYGGRADLANGLVRAIPEARERYREDPLRMLRLVRFAVQLSFEVDPESINAVVETRELLSDIAIERVREEFNKILLSAEAVRGVQMLEELRLLELFLPEVSAMKGFEQNRFHHLDLFDHTLLVLGGLRAELRLRLAGLFHDIGKIPTLSVDSAGERHFYRHEQVGAEESRDILTRMRYPHSLIRDVSTLIQTHMRPLDAGPSGLRRLLRDTEGQFELWRELKEADARATLLEEKVLEEDLRVFDERIAEIRSQPDVSPLKNLAVNGNDLLALGMKPGPAVGEILRVLHEAVLDEPQLNTREVLLEKAKDLLESKYVRDNKERGSSNSGRD